MKRIQKNNEPNSLLQHRANPPAFFDNLSLAAKDELRESLLNEQGYICCYCMKRIPEKVNGVVSMTNGMKIEHYCCQDLFDDLQLIYSNLFGACLGNKGMQKHMETCDTKKGNSLLTINLTATNPDCETLIKYRANGEIYSDTAEIDTQLNEVLNLNMQTLVENRRSVYEEVSKRVEVESKRYSNNNLKLSFFQCEKTRWLSTTDSKLKEYCMVAVYYLNKKIRQNQ